jgi:hypothetical protein
VHPKLVWVDGLIASLSLALGTSITRSIEDTVDPLKKLVVLELGEDLGKGDWNPVQRMIHVFAKSNDVVVERIHKQPKRLTLVVLVKTRFGQVQNKNPLRDKG